MRILSIDGGGIRGILPGVILVYLEKHLQKRSRNSDARIADYFDLLVGTSTGAILVCLYLSPLSRKNSRRPMFSASDAVDLYLDRGDDIFDISLWQRIKSGAGVLDERYSPCALEEALDDYLGDCKLSELLKPCLITSYDIRRRKAHFFRQHRAAQPGKADFYVKDVARATSAAPTYFETAKISSLSRPKMRYSLIDGGIFANNPALCAYAEARTFKVLKKKEKTEQNCTAETMFMLSLGTGRNKRPYHYKEAKDWGALGWAKPALNIMMSGVAETVDYQLMQIFGSVNRDSRYVRIEPDLAGANHDLDDATSENLLALKRAGEECVRNNTQTLDDVLDTLLQWDYTIK